MKIANWFGRAASVSQILADLQRWSSEKCLEVEWACWPGRKGDIETRGATKTFCSWEV